MAGWLRLKVPGGGRSGGNSDNMADTYRQVEQRSLFLQGSTV